MPVIKKLIDLHKGKMTIQSQKNKGTIVKIYFNLSNESIELTTYKFIFFSTKKEILLKNILQFSLNNIKRPSHIFLETNSGKIRLSNNLLPNQFKGFSMKLLVEKLNNKITECGQHTTSNA